MAVGADGLLVEVHDQPEEALSDGRQALSPEEFRNLVPELKSIHPIVSGGQHATQEGLISAPGGEDI